MLSTSSFILKISSNFFKHSKFARMEGMEERMEGMEESVRAAAEKLKELHVGTFCSVFGKE